jgi:hypothetical protein
MGCMSNGGIMATPSRSVQRVTVAAKSWNCVAGTIVPGAHDALLLAFAGVVCVALYPIKADYREQHMVAHSGASLSGEQIARGGAEVGHRFGPVARCHVRDVDDRLDTVQDGLQAFAGHQVDADRAADAHDVVALLFESCNDEGSDVAGGSGDCDPQRGSPPVRS